MASTHLNNCRGCKEEEFIKEIYGLDGVESFLKIWLRSFQALVKSGRSFVFPTICCQHSLIESHRTQLHSALSNPASARIYTSGQHPVVLDPFPSGP